MRSARASRRPAAGVAVGTLRFVASLALVLPSLVSALEPRFDHRDQQGPTAEFLVVEDVHWRGATHAASSLRGAVRVAWGFDPAGDGDEIFLGATFTALDRASAGDDRVLLAFDARYRACMGTEELKTILDVGLWGSASERVAVGPLVGIGIIYDFSRNFGMLTSAFLGAGIGESRIVSFGGGVGVQYRFE